MVQHIHRTAIFKVHNPTRHIRAVFDQAFTLYTQACTTIFHHFSSYGVDELHAMATYAIGEHGEQLTSAKQLAKSLFDRDVPSITSALQPLEGSMRESLKQHIAEALLSYIELSLNPKETPSYPERMRTMDKESTRHEALHELAVLADDKEREDMLFAQLQRTRQSDITPIFFCRVEAVRNCGLFYNPDTKQFYARLFVVSPKSHHAKPLTMAGRYIDIRTGAIYTRKEDIQEGLESFGVGKGSIMVLLEMGRWHEQALRFTESAFLPQRNGDAMPATPVSAHLVKRGDEYYLHVAFRLPKPERVKPQTLLGVDRGITCLASGAVVTLDTRHVLETFITDGTELRTLQKHMEQIIRLKQQKGKITKGDRTRARVNDQHVHICANQIVALAVKYQSQVVMEDLQGFASGYKRPKGQVRNNFQKALGRRQYQKIQDVVNMKLALVGLPPIRTVPAAYTSQTCSQCGHISKENRNGEDRTQFCCVACQHSDHADIQAGINIARKLPYLIKRGEEKQRGVAEEARTTWADYIKRFLASERPATLQYP